MTPARGDARIKRLESACSRLVRHYPVAGWWPARSRFEVMAGAVLVQNTRWANVASAIRALRRARCLTPAALAALRAAQLEDLIRTAGCQSVKARRLRALADRIERAGGLRRLALLDTAELRRVLLDVHGIGPETADAILCFGFDRPVFIADKYARVWLTRMGLLPKSALHDYEQARRSADHWVEGSHLSMRDAHAAIVLHGQSACGAEPRCNECVLRDACRFAH